MWIFNCILKLYACESNYKLGLVAYPVIKAIVVSQFELWTFGRGWGQKSSLEAAGTLWVAAASPGSKSKIHLGCGLVLGPLWLSLGPFVRPKSDSAEFHISVVFKLQLVWCQDWAEHPFIQAVWSSNCLVKGGWARGPEKWDIPLLDLWIKGPKPNQTNQKQPLKILIVSSWFSFTLNKIRWFFE